MIIICFCLFNKERKNTMFRKKALTYIDIYTRVLARVPPCSLLRRGLLFAVSVSCSRAFCALHELQCVYRLYPKHLSPFLSSYIICKQDEEKKRMVTYYSYISCDRKFPANASFVSSDFFGRKIKKRKVYTRSTYK